MRRVAVLLMLSLLGGCETSGHLYSDKYGCLTCINDPITGEPMNHEGEEAVTISTRSTSPTWSDTYTTVDTVDWDVDVLFARFNRLWDFQSTEDLRKARGESRADLAMRDKSYAWETLPGVTYTVGQSVEETAQDVRLVYRLHLEKTAQNTTRMELAYRTYGTLDDPEGFMQDKLKPVLTH